MDRKVQTQTEPRKRAIDDYCMMLRIFDMSAEEQEIAIARLIDKGLATRPSEIRERLYFRDVSCDIPRVAPTCEPKPLSDTVLDRWATYTHIARNEE